MYHKCEVDHNLKQNINFDLDRSSLAKLQQLSKDEAISKSMIIDQMLVQYLGSRSASTLTDYIPIRKILLIKLLEKFTEKEVTEIARSIARISTKKIIYRLRQEHHIMSSIDVVEALIRISSHKYIHDVNYGIHRFTIQHNLGKKWSLYLYEIYSSVLRQFKFKKIDIEVTANQITFTVIVKAIM
jgi:hypothetical protein